MRKKDKNCNGNCACEGQQDRVESTGIFTPGDDTCGSAAQAMPEPTLYSAADIIEAYNIGRIAGIGVGSADTIQEYSLDALEGLLDEGGVR